MLIGIWLSVDSLWGIRQAWIWTKEPDMPILLASLFLVSVLFQGTVPPSRPAPPASTASDAKAIEATLRDYIEGYFTADAARMARALAPELAKRRISEGGGRSQLQHRVCFQIPAGRGGVQPGCSARNGPQGDVVASSKGHDNAERPAGPAPPGWGGGRRHAASGSLVVAELPPASPSLPGSPGAPSAASANLKTDPRDATRLLELGRQSAQFKHSPEDARIRELRVLYVRGPLAMAVVETGAFVDCCQLAKVEGAWKLVNVLWASQPVVR